MYRLEPGEYVEAADADVEHAQGQILQTGDGRDEACITGRRSDGQIELAVRREKLDQLGVARQLVTTLRYLAQPVESRRRETGNGREFCGPRLEEDPQSIDVLHVLEGQRSDAQVAFIRFIDQPFLHEALQRRSNGGLPKIEALSQRCLGDPTPRRQLVEEDLGTNLLVGLLT